MLAWNLLERIGRSLAFEMLFGLVAFTISRCNMSFVGIISLATTSEVPTNICTVCARNIGLLSLAVHAIDWQFAPRVLGAPNRFDPRRPCGFRTTAGPTSRLLHGLTNTEFAVGIQAGENGPLTGHQVWFSEAQSAQRFSRQKMEKISTVAQLWHKGICEQIMRDANFRICVPHGVFCGAKGQN
jgi:hypothetical protein